MTTKVAVKKLDIAVNKIGAWSVIEDEGETFRFIASAGSKAEAERKMKRLAQAKNRKIVRGTAKRLLKAWGWTF